MKAEDFEDLMDMCQIMLDENNKVTFTPWWRKDAKHIAEILKNNALENPSLEDFNALTQKHYPLYQARRKIKQQKIERFAELSPEQVSVLPTEQKIEYMELLFPRNQTMNDVMEVCKKNEDNIKACLFNMDFPKSFWDSEKESADRYAALIASSAEITDKLKNWPETSLQDKKDTIVQAAEIFKYVYGTVPEIGFFTPEEEKARLRQAGLNENAHINAAFYRSGKICFNEERLQESDNYFAVSVLFHEGTHHRQETQSFDNPLVNRIFNANISNINVYENELNNKGDKSYKDLYTMLPDEVHAYGIQEYMEKQLAEKTGIVKTAAVNKEADKIHNKALAMAKLAQYRAK